MFPRLGLLLIACAGTASAADFGFNVLIRAGLAGNGDWEVGMGLSSSGVPSVSGQLNPYYLNGSPQRFEIGYTGSTGTAYTRIYADSTNATRILELTYAVPNGSSNPNGQWTLPAGSFYASAGGIAVPTSSTAANLELQTGTGALSLASLAAVNPGGSTGFVAQPNIVFYSQSNGDWMLSGLLSFTGLRAYVPNGAGRSQLQLGLTATANTSAVPEPASMAVTGVALLVMAGLVRRRRVR
jgi:hypothetical protein